MASVQRCLSSEAGTTLWIRPIPPVVAYLDLERAMPDTSNGSVESRRILIEQIRLQLPQSSQIHESLAEAVPMRREPHRQLGDLDTARDTAGPHPRSGVDGVTPQVEEDAAGSDDSPDGRPAGQPDPQLELQRRAPRASWRLPTASAEQRR